MARFNTFALLVAALACVACTQARDLQQTSSTCTVRTSAKSFSSNQVVCKGAYQSAFHSIYAHFCTNPTEPVPPTVYAILDASVTTVTQAVAQGMAKISYSATISPSCEIGSYSYFSALARAKAMARAVSQSFIQASIDIVGQNNYAGVETFVVAASDALAATCETKFIEINGYHLCDKGTCGSTCPVTCYYKDEGMIEAIATAIAEAFVTVEAEIETYVNGDACDDNCTLELCGYVCADGC